MKPLHHNVLLKTKQEERTEGGLFVPGTVSARYPKAEVVAVGPGRYIDGTLVPVCVDVGDVVVYDSTGAIELDTDQGKLVITSADYLLATCN